MLTYSPIAAGEPASATAMSDHLLTRTLPREVADLARYYTQGMDAAGSAEDRTVAEGDRAVEIEEEDGVHGVLSVGTLRP